MPLRRARPVTWTPAGCSDAIDASSVFPGAMASLADMVRSLSTRGQWVSRPAATSLTTFAGFSTPGAPTGMLVVGDVCYGMVPSARNSGHDEPFALTLGGAFLTVAGITNANTPTSPVGAGYVPPILAQVGGRIIVTHLGFPGGATKFGWFDVSGFTLTTTGTTTNLSAIITGNPTILGVQPGMTITGTNIPASTTVIATASVTVSATCVIVQGGTTLLQNVSSLLNASIGQQVAGPFIPAGTTITNVDAANARVTISNTITLNQSVGGIPVVFTGSTITMSAAATGAGTPTLTIAGGTAAAPLWGAGDLNVNALPSQPVGVASMNGRAYFACGTNGVPFSDSGFACQRSFASQALVPNDGVPVTAVAALPLDSPITGGQVQSIVVVQGVTEMQQITGDAATGNLAMNRLNVATGTYSPLSLAPTTYGLAFLSPTGVRLIDFAGHIGDPLGTDGLGITVPFINQMGSPNFRCAIAANADSLRVLLVDFNTGLPTQEWWYDLVDKVWSGPHSFPGQLIQGWRGSFVKTVASPTAAIFRSDVLPIPTSTYTENSVPMTSTWKTALLPENEEMAENAVVEATIGMLLPNSTTATITALDESGATLDTVTIASGSGGGYYRAWPIRWTKPLVFKQMQIQVSVPSSLTLSVGTLRLRYQVLGYSMQPVPAGAAA